MEYFQLDINSQQFITCTGYFAPEADKILVIVPATGVLQSFYRKLAEFFQENGISVITFDYAGIGRSLNGNIKNEKSLLKNWGNRDLEAVLQYTLTNYPDQQIILLGHSLGGQLIGLAPSSVKVEKIILVASQSGYWKYWKGSDRIRMWLNWHILVPVLSGIYGYLPSGSISRMENLPGNVVKDWAEWCRNRNYLFGSIKNDELYFSKVCCKLSSIRISDDYYAPAKSVDWLTAKYTHAVIKELQLSPENFGVSKIGHFSLFTEKFSNSIWNILFKEVIN